MIASGRSPDASQAARRLIEEFGSIGQVLATDAANQMRVCEDDAAVRVLSNFRAQMRYVLRSQALSRPIVDSWDALARYVAFDMSAKHAEQLRVLYLDAKNRLIREETASLGTLDRTPMHPREIIRRALELNAAALILIHNHPSGDPTPSPSDLLGTRRVRDAAALFDIVLHDHLVVAAGGVRSVFGVADSGRDANSFSLERRRS